MMDNLEMLTAREQLMEDIDSIVETFCWEMWEGKYPETQEDLTRILCDAVVKNFPAKWTQLLQLIGFKLQRTRDIYPS